MKKSKITHIGMAALVAMGMLGTSCNKAESPEIETPETQKENIVTLTTTIGFDEAATRALAIDYDAHTLTKTFAVGDQIALNYRNTSSQPAKAVSKALTAGDISAGGKSATFTFELTDPRKSGIVTYIYPAAMASENGYNWDNLNTQDGTLASIASNLDCARGGGAWSGDDLPSVTMTNGVAIIAYTLKDETGENDITSTITGMTISKGTRTYTINGKDPDGHIYAAIWPTDNENIEYTATDGTKNYTKSVTGKTYETGQFYQVGLRMAEAAPAPAATSLSELKTAINGGTDCSSYIGWKVNSAGAIAESGISGTKIGYVAYVSTSDVDADVSGSRILVIASADAAATTLTWGSDGTARGVEAVENANDLNGYSNTNTLQGYGSEAHPAAYAAWNYSATIPSGGASPAHWFMPTKKQWENMRDAKGGAYSAMATAYGIDGNYWTSNEYFNGEDYSECKNYAWRFAPNSTIMSFRKLFDINVRSIFAY